MERIADCLIGGQCDLVNRRLGGIESMKSPFRFITRQEKDKTF